MNRKPCDTQVPLLTEPPYFKKNNFMPSKKKYTEEQEKKVWELSAQGLLFKQISSEMGDIPTGTIYRLLQCAIDKWGFPKL